LGVYAKHSEDFITEQPGVEDIEDKLAFKLLRKDPEARLLIYFHGNSATLAQQRRTEEYRSYSSGASGRIFILTFDYRGFGKSTGSPSETGLLSDAEAVVDWALNTAKISPDRIVLLGHSLGTAVVAGIAHQYSKVDIEFAGLILCAAFTNAGGAFASYSIGGIVSVLAPIKLSSSFQTWFSSKMRDTWHSDHRLAEIARKLFVLVRLLTPALVLQFFCGDWSGSFCLNACQTAKQCQVERCADRVPGRCSRLKLVFVHAENDTTMPWVETEELFKSTLKAAVEVTSPHDGIPKDLKVVDLGEAGRQEVWQTGSKCIQKTIAKHGGKRESPLPDPDPDPNGSCLGPFLDLFVAAQRLDTTALLRLF
jgi:abhydrolase domain-containing protein 12